jgi:hypothetical protein
MSGGNEHMVTLAEACSRLGWGESAAAQERLYARLRRAEQRLGQVIIVTTGRRGSPVRIAWHHVLQVTRTSSAVDRISGSDWTHSLDELDARIADIADRRIDLRVVPQLAKVDAETENLAKAIEDLRDRVYRLA